MQNSINIDHKKDLIFPSFDGSLWVKNTTNNTMLIKGLKVDLTDTVTDSIVDEIADITKRIIYKKRWSIQSIQAIFL